MMATTFVPIQSVTLASSAASVTFSAIPQTYTDLVVRHSTRSLYNDGSSGFITLYVQFNGGTTGYYVTRLYGTSGTAASDRFAISAVGFVNTDYTTANTYGSGELYIPNYMGSTTKQISGASVEESNSSTIAAVGATATYSDLTSAITSLLLKPSGTYEFKAGSQFHLYGIKNS